MENTNNNPFDDLESWLEGNLQFCESCQKLSKTVKNREAVLKKLKSKIISTDKIIKQFQLKKNELSQTQWQLADTTDKLKKAERLTQTLQLACLQKKIPSEQGGNEFEKKLAEKDSIIKDLQERLKFTESEQKLFKESSQASLSETEKLRDEIKRQSKLISSLEQNHKRKILQLEKSKKEIDESKSSLAEMKKHVKSLEKELSQLKERNEKYSPIVLDNGLLPKTDPQVVNKKKNNQLCNGENVPSVDFMSDDDDNDGDDVGKKKEVKIPKMIDVNSIIEEFRTFPQMLSPIPSVDESELDSSLESSDKSVNDLARLLEEEFLQNSVLSNQESDKNQTEVILSETTSVDPRKNSTSPDLIVSSTPSLSNLDSFPKSDTKKKFPADTSLKPPASAVKESSAVGHLSSDFVDGKLKTKSNPLVPVFSTNKSSNCHRGTESATFGNLSTDSDDDEEEFRTSPQSTSSLTNKLSCPQLESSTNGALKKFTKEHQQKSPKLCSSEPPLSDDKVCKVKGQMLKDSSGKPVEPVILDKQDHGPNPSKTCTEMAHSSDQTKAAKNNLESGEQVINPEKYSTHKQIPLYKSNMINLFGSEYLSSSSDDDSDEEKANVHPTPPGEAELLTLPGETELLSPSAEAEHLSPPAETEPPTPLDKTEPPTPLDKTEPPTPLDETEPPTPLDETEPPTPLDETEPSTPLDKTEPPTPLDKTEPPTPLDKTEPPTPLDKTEPSTPLDKIKSPSSVKTNPDIIPLETTTIANSPTFEIDSQKPSSITNSKSEKSLENGDNKPISLPRELLSKDDSGLNNEVVQKTPTDKLSKDDSCLNKGFFIEPNSASNNSVDCKTDPSVFSNAPPSDLKNASDTNPSFEHLQNPDQNSKDLSPKTVSCVAHQETHPTTLKEFCLIVSSKSADDQVCPKILCSKSGPSETEKPMESVRHLKNSPEKVSATYDLQEDQESTMVNENYSETSVKDKCSLTDTPEASITNSQEETKKTSQNSSSECPMEVELCLKSTKNYGVDREILKATITKNSNLFEGNQNLASAKEKDQNGSFNFLLPFDTGCQSFVSKDHLTKKSVKLTTLDELSISLSDKNQLDNKSNNEIKTLHQVNVNTEDVVLKGNHRDIDGMKENHEDINDVKENHMDICDIEENRMDIVDVEDNHRDVCDVKENHRDVCDVKENHRDVCDVKENHRDVCDVKENHRDVCDVKENHRDVCDVKENHRDVCDVKENHRDVCDVKENHRDVCDVKENHRDIIDIEENYRDIVDIEKNHRDIVDLEENHRDIVDTKGNHKDIVASVDVHQSLTEEFKMRTKKEHELPKNDAENASSHLHPVMVDVAQSTSEIQGKSTGNSPELNLKNSVKGCVLGTPDINSSLEISSPKEGVNDPSSNAPSIDKTYPKISEPISHNPDTCKRILNNCLRASFPSTRLHSTSPSGVDKAADDTTVPKRLDKVISSLENNALVKKPNVLTEANTNKVDHSSSLTSQSIIGEKGSLDPDSIFDVAECLLSLRGYGAVNGSSLSDKENELMNVSDKLVPNGTDLKKSNRADSVPDSAAVPNFIRCNSADDEDYQFVDLNGSKSSSEDSEDAEISTKGMGNIPNGLSSGSSSENGSRENGEALCNINKIPQNIEVSESPKISVEETRCRHSSSSSSSEISRESETPRGYSENSKRLDCVHKSSEDNEESANIKTDSLEESRELGITSRLLDAESSTNCIDNKRLKDFNQLSESHLESETLRNDTEENGTKFDDSSTMESESLGNAELSKNEENGKKLDSSTARVEINETSECLENSTKKISEKFIHSDGVREDTVNPDHSTKNEGQSMNNKLPFIGVSLESKDVYNAAERNESDDLNVCDNLVTRENSIFSSKSNDYVEGTLSVNVDNSQSNDNVEGTLSVGVNKFSSNDNVDETSVSVNNSQSNDNVKEALSISVDTLQSDHNVGGILSVRANDSQSNDDVEGTLLISADNSQIIPVKEDDVHNDSLKHSVAGDLSSVEEFSDFDSIELVHVAKKNHVKNVNINELFGDDDDDDDDPSNPESEGRVTITEPKNSTSSLSSDSSDDVVNQNLVPLSVNKVTAEKYNSQLALNDSKKQVHLNGFSTSLSRKKRKPVFRMAANPNKPPKVSRKSVAVTLCKAKTEDAVINSKRKFIKFVASSEKPFVLSQLEDPAANDNSSPSIKEEEKKDEVPVKPISKPTDAILKNCLPSSKMVPDVPLKTDCSLLQNDTFSEELFARRPSEDICDLIKEFIFVARPISPLPATPEKSVPQSHNYSTPPPKEQINPDISTPTSSSSPESDYLKNIKSLLNMVSQLSPIVTPKKLQERRSKKCLSKEFAPNDEAESATVNGASLCPETFAADADSGNGGNKTDFLLHSDSPNPHQSKTTAAEANPAMEIDASQSSADKTCLNTQQRLLRKTRSSRRICPATVTSCNKNSKSDPKKRTNSSKPKEVSKSSTNAKLPPRSPSPQKMDVSLEITPKPAVEELDEPKMEIIDSVEPEKVSSRADSADGGEKLVRKRKLDTTEALTNNSHEEKKQCVKNNAILTRARTSLMKVAQRELQTYWKYVSSAPSQVLQKLLQTNREAELIAEVVAAQTAKLLSSATDNMLPWYITKCKSNEPTPYFSDKEKHLLRLLCLFKRKKDMGNIFTKFRECLKETLTKQDWDSMCLGKWSLCRMYIAMCRLEGCLSEARVFFYESFCRLPCEQYVTFAVVTACTWPDVLSYERIDGRVSLFRIIEYAVIKCINEKPHNKKYLECLTKHCKWKPSGNTKDNDIQRSLFEHLHDCIEEGATKDEIFCYVKGIELLSSQEKWLWTRTVLSSRMYQLLKKCLQLEPPEDRQSEFDCLLRHVFQMLGNLCMKSKERHRTITFVMNSLLKPFLISDKFSSEVHLCCARVVMRLYPFEPSIAYPLLESWFQENLSWEPSSKLMSQWIILKNQLNKEMGVT